MLEKIGTFQDIEDIDLDTLLKVTTEAGGALTAEDEPGSVTVVTEEDIRRSGARTVLEVLETVAGLEVLSDSLGRGRIVVRGVPAGLSWGGSENVLVLLNGFKLNENLTGGATAVNLDIPVDNIKRIEVVRGPGSVLHGPGALLGIVNIVTESVDTFRRDELVLGGGSFDSFLYNFRYGTTIKEMSLAGFLQYSRTDGPALLVASDSQTETDRALGPLGVPAASLAPGKTMEDREALDANLAVAFRRFTFNLRRKEESSGGFVGLLDVLGTRNRLDNKQTTVEAHYRSSVPRVGEVKAQVGFSQSEMVRFLDILPPGFTLVDARSRTRFTSGVAVQDDLNSRRFGGEVTLDHQASPRHAVTAGLALERETTFGLQLMSNLDFVQMTPLPGFRALPELVPQAERTVLSLFGQDTWTPLRRLAVKGGLRLEAYEDYGTKLSPRLALIYRMPRDLNLKLSYGRGFHTPSFGERFYTTPALASNPALTRMRIDSLDLSALYRRKDFHLSATVYAFAVRDVIAMAPLAVPRGTLRGQLTNREGIDGRGLDLEASRTFEGHRSLQLVYSLQDPTDAATSRRLAGTPRHLVRVAGHLETGRYVILSPSLTVRSSRPREEGDPRLPLSGYGLLDFVVRVRNVHPRWEAFFSVHNLLDLEYQDPAFRGGLPGDYPRPGVSLFLKARYRF